MGRFSGWENEWVGADEIGGGQMEMGGVGGEMNGDRWCGCKDKWRWVVWVER